MYCFNTSAKCFPIDLTLLVTVLRDNCKSFVADKISDLFLKFSNKAFALSKKACFTISLVRNDFYS